MKNKLATVVLLFLLSCSSTKNGISTDIFGSYLYVDKKDVFYNEIELSLDRDSSFYYLQTVHGIGYRVNGKFQYLGNTKYLLVILDTPMQVPKVPLYDFYHIKDTMHFFNTNKVLINGRRFKKEKED